MRKTIAIIDTLWGGHHPTYFKLFCKIAIEQGHKVLALSPAYSEIAEWKNENNYTSDQIEIFYCQEIEPFHFLIHFIGDIVTTYKRWYNVKNSLGNAKPDLVFFPWLDNYLNEFLLPFIHKIIFPFSWSGIYFHPLFLRIKSKNILRRKYRESTTNIFKSNKCIKVAILDEGVSVELQGIIGDKMTVFPDIADYSSPDFEYPIVRKIIVEIKNRKVIMLPGALAKRKGFFMLLETAFNCSSKNWFFVFVGKLIRDTFSDEELYLIDELASNPPENCFFFLERIPKEAQFNALIAASDVIFACYDNFPHSSNILTKASLFKKPVITSNRFCMGERVEEFGLGETINEGDLDDCIKAIMQLTKRNNTIEDMNFKKYASSHSINELTEKFSLLLSS